MNAGFDVCMKGTKKGYRIENLYKKKSPHMTQSQWDFAKFVKIWFLHKI